MAVQVYRGIPVPLVASSARTTSSNSGNLKDTATDLGVASAISLYASVTTFTAATDSTAVQIFLETSPDGGTTWFVAERFANITTSTAVRRIDFRNTGIGITEVAAQASIIRTTSGAVTQNTVLSADNRITWEIPASSTVTFSVWAIVSPIGTQNG